MKSSKNLKGVSKVHKLNLLDHKLIKFGKKNLATLVTPKSQKRKSAKAKNLKAKVKVQVQVETKVKVKVKEKVKRKVALKKTIIWFH